MTSASGPGFSAATVAAVTVGYARCSTDERDVDAQRRILTGLGVPAENIYLDRGPATRNGSRPALERALEVSSPRGTLTVPNLSRLARSLTDAVEIGKRLLARGTTLSLGGRRHDPATPTGALFFDLIADVAVFEMDLVRMRTRDGLAIARAKGKLKGKPPKLSDGQQDMVVALYQSNKHTVVDIANLFNVSRSSVYRVLDRRGIGRSGDEIAMIAVDLEIGPEPGVENAG
jgi:DNA invertase Pin-like site-specific DNA recombinase